CLLRLAPGDAAYLERRGDRLCGTLPDPEDAAALAALLRCFVEQRYRPVFEASVDRMLTLAASLNLPRPELYMRWMTSRWGSCTMAKGKITLNWALVGAAPADIDAVVLHELVHFRQPDHSAAFYRTLYALMPDYPERHARVRQLPAGFWKIDRKG
ncbi:MAG: M48 family metallopeptidase, partial [Acutalibacteraceae bacterium]